MKKALFLLFAIPALLMGQSKKAQIWKVSPDTICPGDSIKVHYRLPTPVDPTHSFYIQSPYIILGTYSTASLLAQPQESVGTSLCYYIWIPVPQSLPVGTYPLWTDPQQTPMFDFTAKNCSCTISTSFTSTTSELTTTLTANTVGSNSTTLYYWDFGFGWQQGTPVQTYTYSTAGTYTVGLNVVNPTCQDTYSATVSVSVTPTQTTNVGMSEYQLNEIKPVYFDLYGNKTEKKAGIILIEQRGTIYRKIVIH